MKTKMLLCATAIAAALAGPAYADDTAEYGNNIICAVLFANMAPERVGTGPRKKIEAAAKLSNFFFERAGEGFSFTKGAGFSERKNATATRLRAMAVDQLNDTLVTMSEKDQESVAAECAVIAVDAGYNLKG